ncbi:MAG: MFS transporter [Oscillochloris sp.]|nr:MFS transporter [Oscillochloris sp.]
MLSETVHSGRSPLAIPAFRWLWAGWTFTGLGIQVYAVALVWLVLELTGSGLNLGTVLTAAAVPRAMIMLVSGVLIDRTSPRLALLVAGLISAVLLGSLAVLTALGWIQFLGLLAIAAVQGLMDAFFYPAAMAQLARTVVPAQLTQANALFQTSDSIANILGPALGGLLVGAVGLVPALGVNSGLFLIGVLLILAISPTAEQQALDQPEMPFGKALIEGLRYAWERPAVRLSLVMIALLNFAAIGPTLVGGAMLVSQRFGGEATMFGWLLAGYGVGALFGGLGAGWMPKVAHPNLLLAWLMVGMGLGMGLTGVAPNFWVAFGLQAAMGVGVGMLTVIAVSWLQEQTSAAMQGRMASLLVFSAVALDPFSNGLAGVISELSLTGLFVGAGVLMLVVGIVVLGRREG